MEEQKQNLAGQTKEITTYEIYLSKNFRMDWDKLMNSSEQKDVAPAINPQEDPREDEDLPLNKKTQQ